MMKLFIALCTVMLCCGLVTNGQNPSDEEAKQAIIKLLKKNYGNTATDSRKFIWDKADLNDDRKNEYLVGLTGPEWCGNKGCTMLVLTHDFKVNSRMTLVRFPVYVGAPGKEVTKGYANIYIPIGNNMALMMYNGKKYPSNPSMVKTIKTAVIAGKHPFLDESKQVAVKF